MKLFVPGRICIFGEHSDWAGGYRRINADVEKGYTLITGTDQGIYAEVEPHPTSLILTSTSPEGEKVGPYEIPMEPNTLLEEAQKGGFWSYIAGVAYQVQTNYHVRGLVINNYKTDLPVKKGLSSSAAICVLAARAFNHIYDLKLTIRGEMELAYMGEITTPSRCGRMDQGCAFGNRPVLMIFDGDRLDTIELQVEEELYFVVVDLGAEKDTMEILNRLNRCYPFAENDLERGVQELLGPINKRVTQQAVELLSNSEGEHLGKLMGEAQSFFDRYAIPVCPEELSAPVLHRVLEHEPLKPHIWGGKGVGSQGDGTAQFIARSLADQQAVIEILERDLGVECLELTLRPGQQVRKAVIPAAGFGTRLFPATKATKKELFPIIDQDGIAKPAILLIVEEALDAGLEEVIIIVQEDDLEDFHSFFNAQVSIENYNKLPPHFQEYAQRLLEIGRRVTFVTQQTQQGFGHAVYSAREAIGDEPFLLMLGDHLYRSSDGNSCAKQLLDAYQQHGINVLGLRRTPEDQIANFGTVAGVWMDEERLLNVTEFAEKPTIDYARNNLLVPGLAADEYLTVFGLYIIKPQIFEYLEEHIENNVRERGEFQLTSALDSLRRDEGFLGLIMEGRRYDIGLPQYYLDTLQAFVEKGI
ncbi:MAG: sugar phosphate nucleotidyltransferase [Anaerolineales bacterium]|nr:sugar phosphate nucleotidyltransferase [Anaerolineales bacterium]HUV26312.1 sugar phosphate nucleotidyltransferase [Anaerolineales bacterium]